MASGAQCLLALTSPQRCPGLFVRNCAGRKEKMLLPHGPRARGTFKQALPGCEATWAGAFQNLRLAWAAHGAYLTSPHQASTSPLLSLTPALLSKGEVFSFLKIHSFILLFGCGRSLSLHTSLLSGCREWGLLFAEVSGLPITVPSPAWSTGSRRADFSSCSAWVPEHRLSSWGAASLSPRHVGSPWTSDHQRSNRCPLLYKVD